MSCRGWIRRARIAFATWGAELRRLGPALRRRMIERWGDYPKTLAAFSAALSAKGSRTREVDTFATLMACAWLGSRSKRRRRAMRGDRLGRLGVDVRAGDERDRGRMAAVPHASHHGKVEWFSRGKKETIGELITMTLDNQPEARSALKGYGLAHVKRTSRVETAAAEAKGEGKPPPARMDRGVLRASGPRGNLQGHAVARRRVARAVADAGREGNHPANFAGKKRDKAWLLPIAEFKPQAGDEKYADDPDEEAAARRSRRDVICHRCHHFRARG
jgi:hypothetical protein